MRDGLDEETRVELGNRAVFKLIPVISVDPALVIRSHTLTQARDNVS